MSLFVCLIVVVISRICTICTCKNFIAPHHSTDSMHNHNISNKTHDYGLGCRDDNDSDITKSLQTDSPLVGEFERLSKFAHTNHNTSIDGIGTTQRVAETPNLNRSGIQAELKESKEDDSKSSKKDKKSTNNSKSKGKHQRSKSFKFVLASELTAEDHTYLDKLNIFFYESNESYRYVPRSIFVDLDPTILDSIKASKIGKLYKNDNFIFGNNSAANNYAKGRYTEGADLESEVMDVIRREAEDCDCLQSIQMTHAIGGGTGSGLGSLLQESLRDYFKDRIQCAYTIFPSKNTSQIVVEDYNAVLALNDLISNVDESFVIDNHSLFNISDKLKMGSSLRELVCV